MSAPATDLSGTFRNCVMSADRVYRYLLRIEWNPARPTWAVIGLNPSTADESTDDPTVRKWRGFAQRGGAGGITIVNQFALRATDSREMKRHSAPIGPDNDRWILRAAEECERVILCWGVHGSHLDRDIAIGRLLRGHPTPLLYCWGRTKNGQPRHPLMLPYSTPLERIR